MADVSRPYIHRWPGHAAAVDPFTQHDMRPDFIDAKDIIAKIEERARLQVGVLSKNLGNSYGMGESQLKTFLNKMGADVENMLKPQSSSNSIGLSKDFEEGRRIYHSTFNKSKKNVSNINKYIKELQQLIRKTSEFLKNFETLMQIDFDALIAQITIEGINLKDYGALQNKREEFLNQAEQYLVSINKKVDKRLLIILFHYYQLRDALAKGYQNKNDLEEGRPVVNHAISTMVGMCGILSGLIEEEVVQRAIQNNEDVNKTIEKTFNSFGKDGLIKISRSGTKKYESQVNASVTSKGDVTISLSEKGDSASISIQIPMSVKVTGRKNMKKNQISVETGTTLMQVLQNIDFPTGDNNLYQGLLNLLLHGFKKVTSEKDNFSYSPGNRNKVLRSIAKANAVSALAGTQAKGGANMQAAFLIINRKAYQLTELIDQILLDETNSYLKGSLDKNINDSDMGIRAIQKHRQIGKKISSGQTPMDAANEASIEARKYIEQIHFNTKLNLNKLTI